MAELFNAPIVLAGLGDSYASGEGAMGGAWTDFVCHRSELAGPKLVADRLMTDLPNSIFQFLACSGATTTGFQGQLRALREGVIDAITVSIGGNDVDFANTL